jgi:hypothetical protein
MTILQRIGSELREVFTNERENALVQRVCAISIFLEFKKEEYYQEKIGQKASNVFKVLNTLEVSLDKLSLDKVAEILQKAISDLNNLHFEENSNLENHAERAQLALRIERLKTYLYLRNNVNYNFEIFRNDITYLSNKQRSIEEGRRMSYLGKGMF